MSRKKTRSKRQADARWRKIEEQMAYTRLTGKRPQKQPKR